MIKAISTSVLLIAMALPSVWAQTNDDHMFLTIDKKHTKYKKWLGPIYQLHSEKLASILSTATDFNGRRFKKDYSSDTRKYILSHSEFRKLKASANESDSLNSARTLRDLTQNPLNSTKSRTWNISIQTPVLSLILSSGADDHSKN